MKTKLTALVFTIFGILVGIVFTGITLNLSAGKMMVKEMKSPYGYEKTIETIVERINAMPEWHVVTVYDMNSEVTKYGGKPIGKYSIIKYCSGKYASEMLIADDRKTMGAMMPKAFAVYEKTDGQVYVATSNGAVMGKLFGGETETLIEKVSLEVEGILRFLNFKYSLF
ncbi:MAG: DUF302 domain-containing protein [Bacteroidales bacterium]|nr:DUF302 domain-containing protein [Bacteroidales bacterium]